MNGSIVWLQTKRLLQCLLIFTSVTPGASAHEFWIEPVEYHIEPGSVIEASLRLGDDFEGSTIAYYKGSTIRFDLVTQGRTEKITPRLGDDPALVLEVPENSLHVVVHQSSIQTLTYLKWEKFQRFADNKDFKNIQARHKARDLADKHFTEAYSRYSKSLIAVGDGAGDDQQTGLEIELVALQNPYTDDLGEGMKVAGYYQGKPHINSQIELFEKAPDGEVEVSLLRTDDRGMVVLPVKSDHHYLVDMVVLREPSKSLTKERGAVWETVWASLTFATGKVSQ